MSSHVGIVTCLLFRFLNLQLHWGSAYVSDCCSSIFRLLCASTVRGLGAPSKLHPYMYIRCEDAGIEPCAHTQTHTRTYTHAYFQLTLLEVGRWIFFIFVCVCVCVRCACQVIHFPLCRTPVRRCAALLPRCGAVCALALFKVQTA